MEPVQELQAWFSAWAEENRGHITHWFKTDEVNVILKLGDKMFVSEEWDVAFVDEEAGRMARLLEFGSQITPKFELISRARAFLLSIFPKYEEDMSIYLLAKELYGV